MSIKGNSTGLLMIVRWADKKIFTDMGTLATFASRENKSETKIASLPCGKRL